MTLSKCKNLMNGINLQVLFFLLFRNFLLIFILKFDILSSKSVSVTCLTKLSNKFESAIY